MTTAGANRGVISWASLLCILATVALMVVAMRFEGRIWWCECGEPDLWKSSVWTSHCSQHLLDPYSASHFSHGLLFWCLFAWMTTGAVGRVTGLASRFSVRWRLVAAVLLAAAWEVAENSPWVIERYRTATMSLDYLGDSVINAVGDVLCCIAGFFTARAIGVRWTLLLFMAIELVMLATIRDNLTLNVIMLVWPIEAIKQWQTQGHEVAWAR